MQDMEYSSELTEEQLSTGDDVVNQASELMSYGDYEKARNILEQHPSSKLEYHRIFGTLEVSEYNYRKAFQHCDAYMDDPNMQKKALFFLANLHRQVGNYDITAKILETLQKSEGKNFPATFTLIYLNMQLHDYEKAYALLETIDANTLKDFFYSHYKMIRLYLLSYMHRLQKSQVSYRSNEYMVARLFAPDDQMLLNHIARHKKPNGHYGVFLPNLKLKSFLQEIRTLLKSCNATSSQMNDFYRMILDWYARGISYL